MQCGGNPLVSAWSAKALAIQSQASKKQRLFLTKTYLMFVGLVFFYSHTAGYKVAELIVHLIEVNSI